MRVLCLSGKAALTNPSVFRLTLRMIPNEPFPMTSSGSYWSRKEVEDMVVRRKNRVGRKTSHTPSVRGSKRSRDRVIASRRRFILIIVPRFPYDRVRPGTNNGRQVDTPNRSPLSPQSYTLLAEGTLNEVVNYCLAFRK